MASGDITSMTTTIVNLAKAGLGLFNEWPLNAVVVAGLLGVGIGLVKSFIPKRRR